MIYSDSTIPCHNTPSHMNYMSYDSYELVIGFRGLGKGRYHSDRIVFSRLTKSPVIHVCPGSDVLRASPWLEAFLPGFVVDHPSVWE